MRASEIAVGAKSGRRSLKQILHVGTFQMQIRSGTAWIAVRVPYLFLMVWSWGAEAAPSLSLTLMNNLCRYFIHDFPAQHPVRKGVGCGALPFPLCPPPADWTLRILQIDGIQTTAAGNKYCANKALFNIARVPKQSQREARRLRPCRLFKFIQMTAHYRNENHRDGKQRRRTPTFLFTHNRPLFFNEMTQFMWK